MRYDFETMVDFEKLFPFWASLSESERKILSSSAKLERYGSGHLLRRADGSCKGVIAVICGALRVFCQSEEGREVTLYRVNAGEVCFLSASCLMDSVVFDVVVETSEDSEICLLPLHVLHRIEKKNKDLSLFLYKNAVEKFSKVLWTLQRILFMKIDKRISLFLLEEIERTSNLFLNITHEEIARQIGSAREVVTKTLKYLSEEGLIKLSRSKIEVCDVAALKKLSGVEGA